MLAPRQVTTGYSIAERAAYRGSRVQKHRRPTCDLREMHKVTFSTVDAIVDEG